MLVWGASGGLGSFAIQLINTAGANAIGVISEENKRDFVLSLGAKGVINRKDFKCWGQMPTVNSAGIQGVAERGAEVRQGDLGHHRQGRECRHGLRAPGRGDLPGLGAGLKKGGMVVICAGTIGFNLTLDVRYLWMHQKRVQGSHFANLKQASGGEPADARAAARPCMSEVFPWAQTPAGAREDAAQRAQARQHGGAGQRADDGAAGRSPTRWRRVGRGESGNVREYHSPLLAGATPDSLGWLALWLSVFLTFQYFGDNAPRYFWGISIGEFNQCRRPW